MTVIPPGPDPATLVTDDAVEAAARVMFRDYERQYSAGHLTWRDFADDAREILESAALMIVAAWQHWEEEQADGR
jgi:hypothetical protein